MKQKLLFILICLLGISSINAQVGTSPARKFNASPVKTDRQQLRAATDGLLYFGYSNDNIENGIGVGDPVELSAAICMPASMSGLYAGKTISKIRIGLDANCTNVSVWIRSSLDGANLVSQTVGNAGVGWTEVTLPTPFTIPASGIYIGYTATGYYQVGFSGNSVYDGCWLWYNGWDNYSEYGWGSVCIQALIDVQGATVLVADPESIERITCSTPNQNFTVQGSIKSYSSVDITSVKISYQIDNQASVEKTIQTSIPAMKSGSISIPINAIASTGIYQLFSVKILEINGQPNSFSNNKSLSGEIRIISQSFPRKIVMEERTGTWCPWCTRGAVGMAMMKEKYPDTYIGIAIHGGDVNEPMRVEAYDNYMGYFTGGFPSMVVDRRWYLTGDPYSDADNFYQSEMTKMPIGSIQLTGGFANADKQAIVLKTVTTFGISFNSANYRLAYVIIENGVTGYSQANNYAGGGNGPMGGYENKPYTITDMVFNDVARGIYSDPTGITGSIPSSITQMVPIEHTYTINLPNSIQNVNQLEVVVMLLNANKGEIENADIIKVSDVANPDISVTGVSLDQTTATLIVGNNLQLTATVAPSNATNKNVSWSSSAPTIASVDGTGKVAALATGTATITVTTDDGNKTATCNVTVNPANVSVTGVSLDQTTATLIVGNNLQLTATIAPSNATNKNVSWSSSAPTIASVDGTGKVAALATGTATITVTTDDGNKTATCNVTVNSANVSVTGVSLNQTTATLIIGNNLQLTATVAPSNATNKNVTWSTSAPTIASVDGTGKVAALATGTATITVTTDDGNFSASCTVTVNQALSSDASLSELTVSQGKLTPAFSPNVTQYTVNVENEVTAINLSAKANNAAATVSGTGTKSLNVGDNVFDIIVTAEDGSKQVYTVTVNRAEQETDPVIYVSGVRLDKSAVTLFVNASELLTATVFPSNADNPFVSWSSNDKTIATVSDNGIVTGIREGKTFITVTTEDGGFTATCTVEVLRQEVVVEGETQVGEDGKGKIVLALKAPSGVLFSGLFLLTLPDGVELDLDATRLAGDLASLLTLTIVQNADGSWSFTIKPLLRSTTADLEYTRIMEIGYKSVGTIENGNYVAFITDLSFVFDDGTSITESEIPVSIAVNSPTGIIEPQVQTFAYLYDGRLYVNTPVAETVRVYSTNGTLLYNFQKPSGSVDYPINTVSGAVLIVTGSSGWEVKVIH